MIRNIKKFVCLTLFTLASHSVFAQPTADEIVDNVTIELFQKHNAKFLCLTEDSSRPAIRALVEVQLKSVAVGTLPSQNMIATVIYTQYPCPFSPYRKELRSATAKDIEGVWLFPESSQKLRFGPKSPSWQSQAALPVRCEGVAYYRDGESRVAQAVGKMACPFASAKDMDSSRLNLRVATWSFIREGRVKIARTDVPDHIEEWDVFVVQSDFQAATTNFHAGDLVEYRRREKGNDFNVATMFRHLQKLP